MSAINLKIVDAIENQKALIFGKIGGVEAQHLAYYLKNKFTNVLNSHTITDLKQWPVFFQ